MGGSELEVPVPLLPSPEAEVAVAAVSAADGAVQSIEDALHAVSGVSLPFLSLSATHRLTLLIVAVVAGGLLARCLIEVWRSRMAGVEDHDEAIDDPATVPTPSSSRRAVRQAGRAVAATVKFAIVKFFQQRKYARIGDESGEDKSAEPSRRLRAHCDLLLVWPSEHLSPDEEKRRSRMFKLIKERLFVFRVFRADDARTPEAGCLGTSPPPAHLYGISTFRADDDDLSKLKAKRLHRLCCRVASSSRLLKWLRGTRPGARSKEGGKWRGRSAEAVWRELQMWRGGEPAEDVTNGRTRTVQPFNEELQQHLDPCGDDFETCKEDEQQRLQQRLETLVFEHAPESEWQSAHVPLLFNSMERLQLLKWILERPVELGGCAVEVDGGVIDLHKAASRGWFTVVPLHDPRRTRTKNLPDEAPEEVVLPTAAARADNGRLRADTHDVGGDIHDVGADFWLAAERVRRATQDGLEMVAAHAAHAMSRVSNRFRARRPRRKRDEGTLISGWLLQKVEVFPRQPLDDIRDYVGVEIALYFAFLEFVVTWTLIPGLVGLLPMLGWVWYDRLDNWVSTVYSVFALLWCFVLSKFWVRRNRELAYRWNTEDAQSSETIRWEFREKHTAEAPSTKHGDRISHGAEDRRAARDRRDRGSKARSGPRHPLAYGFYSPEEYFVRTSAEAPGVMLRLFGREERRVEVVISLVVISCYLAFSIFVLLVILSFRVFLMTIAWDLPPDWWLFAQGGVGGYLYTWRLTIGSGLAVSISSAWTLFSNYVGRRGLAVWLTNRECHRTQHQHETALLYKKFAITFFNSYCALFYVAFLKATAAGKLFGFVFLWFDSWPLARKFATSGGEGQLLVARDYCHDMGNFTRTSAEILQENDGINPHCMDELSSFLMSTMIITALLTVATVGVPIVVRSCKQRSASRLRGLSATAAFYDGQSQMPEWPGVMDDCLDLVIQIGYVVLFAPAFPLAAFVVYVVNLFRQRADAYRLLKLTRRPWPREVSHLFGVSQMLMFISVTGILTNIGLLFFTATQLTAFLREVAQLPLPWFAALRVPSAWNHFAFFVGAEHVLLLVYWAVHLLFLDDDPEIARLRAWSQHFEPKWRQKVCSVHARALAYYGRCLRTALSSARAARPQHRHALASA